MEISDEAIGRLGVAFKNFIDARAAFSGLPGVVDDEVLYEFGKARTDTEEALFRAVSGLLLLIQAKRMTETAKAHVAATLGERGY